MKRAWSWRHPSFWIGPILTGLTFWAVITSVHRHRFDVAAGAAIAAFTLDLWLQLRQLATQDDRPTSSFAAFGVGLGFGVGLADASAGTERVLWLAAAAFGSTALDVGVDWLARRIAATRRGNGA